MRPKTSPKYLVCHCVTFIDQPLNTTLIFRDIQPLTLSSTTTGFEPDPSVAFEIVLESYWKNLNLTLSQTHLGASLGTTFFSGTTQYRGCPEIGEPKTAGN